MAKFTLHISVYIFVCMCSSTFAWKWKSTDALIKEVWPENDRIFKRASAATSDPGKASPGQQRVTETPEVQDDSDEIIFEGRYFSPNEVPPPPDFMVGNNWRGKPGSESSAKIKLHKVEPQTKQSNNFYYIATVGSTTKVPTSHKFTLENVKGHEKILTTSERGPNSLPENRSHYNSFKTQIEAASTDLDDLPYTEELSISDVEFQNAPKCFTATDTQGHCLPFRQCYPVVFNVIDGDLRNPGLAKLLYQSSGPCNATLEFGFAISNKEDDKTFLDASFYNQSICCPGFKHPPTLLRSWGDEIRNTRLTSTYKSPTSSTPSSVSISIRPILRNTTPSVATSEPLDDEDETEASTEGAQSSTSSKDFPEDTTKHTTALERNDTEDDSEEEASMTIDDNENSKDNQTISTENTERDEGSGEARRNLNTNSKQTSNAFLAVPSPSLTPNKCRQQIYGMPRGHWPWMVALVIRSRHICSGALIDERHVVTAAHCVYLLENSDVRKLRVIIGDRVMYSSVDGPHFWRKVSRVITHANYNQQTFAADIAVLKLNSNVPFSRNIQPIGLSDFASLDSSTFTKGLVAGWSGADIGQPSFEARSELETVVDIMDKEECRQVYRGFALSGLATNTFCTKPSNNTCVADSGAPLVVRAHNCWVLGGVMSWGLGCSHFPEVYTDVTRFASWIRRQIV